MSKGRSIRSTTMHIRSKLDARCFEARLKLARVRGRRAFVLELQGANAPAGPLGPVAASLGFEIVSESPAEHAALRLAGFFLGRADRSDCQLQTSVRMLRQQRERQEHRPATARVRHPGWQPHLKCVTGKGTAEHRAASS
jgi:hypothetical protein